MMGLKLCMTSRIVKVIINAVVVFFIIRIFMHAVFLIIYWRTAVMRSWSVREIHSYKIALLRKVVDLVQTVTHTHTYIHMMKRCIGSILLERSVNVTENFETESNVIFYSCILFLLAKHLCNLYMWQFETGKEFPFYAIRFTYLHSHFAV